MNANTTAVVVLAAVAGGEERTHLSVVRVGDGHMAWTLAAPNGGPAATLDSADPAVLAFVAALLGLDVGAVDAPAA